jgi:multiple sugar transport system permease protein
MWTASVGISSFIGQYVTPLDVVFAAATLYAIIPIVFYLFAERWLVAGITRGAVKG